MGGKKVLQFEFALELIIPPPPRLIMLIEIVILLVVREEEKKVVYLSSSWLTRTSVMLIGKVGAFRCHIMSFDAMTK
jgi:hypothetical protein